MIALVIDGFAVIGASFLALVAWLVIDPHKHICSKCSHAWRHFGLWSSGPPGVARADLAHVCRRCGNTQRWRTKERL